MYQIKTLKIGLTPNYLNGDFEAQRADSENPFELEIVRKTKIRYHHVDYLPLEFLTKFRVLVEKKNNKTKWQATRTKNGKSFFLKLIYSLIVVHGL